MSERTTVLMEPIAKLNVRKTCSHSKDRYWPSERRLVLEANRHTSWNQLSFTYSISAVPSNTIMHIQSHVSCWLSCQSSEWSYPTSAGTRGSAPEVVPYMTVRPPGVAWRVMGSASDLIVFRIHERIRRRLAVTWGDSQFDCQCPCDVLYSACHCRLPSMTNEHHLIS